VVAGKRKPTGATGLSLCQCEAAFIGVLAIAGEHFQVKHSMK
jgi:hypothetical protein